MLFKSRGASSSENFFTANISSNQLELNLAAWAASRGWNGAANAEITIDSGVYVYSNNISTPALTTGVFPGTLRIIVNGYIIGKGGMGGSYPTSSTTQGGETGGPAIKLECNATISGGPGSYIAGGGGGGSFANVTATLGRCGGGGGAGGGRGGYIQATLGGAGGDPGASGANGAVNSSGGSLTSENVGRGGGSGGSGASVGATV